MKSMVLSFVLICASSFLAFSASAEDAEETAPAVAVQQPKRLALFLDGTWNAVNDNTNVWRIRALCAPKSTDGKTQLVYYEIGVNGFIGGLFGKGLDENIRQAYEWLVENYNGGDEIFIFGFSRGAYTARALAGLVTKFGILKPGSPIGITQLFDRYKRTDEQTIWELHEQQDAGATSDFTLEERWMLKYSQPAKIKVIGVWDTVGSLGIPAFSIEGISRPTFGYLHTGLRIHIENAYHALAFRNDVDIDGDVNTAPINDSYKEFACGLYSKVVNPLFRKIGEDPEIRDDGTHTNVNETIDGSVFERWRTVPDYRPPNLSEWANRKKVDPAKLTNSVRADDPNVSAPD